MNCMRLSLMKAAHATLDGAAFGNSGASRSFFARCGIPRTSTIFADSAADLHGSPWAPSILKIGTQWKHLQLCHSDRSVTEFPATLAHPNPRVRLSCKESRMKIANAVKINRKFGVAKWSDCSFLHFRADLLSSP